MDKLLSQFASKIFTEHEQVMAELDSMVESFNSVEDLNSIPKNTKKKRCCAVDVVRHLTELNITMEDLEDRNQGHEITNDGLVKLSLLERMLNEFNIRLVKQDPLHEDLLVFNYETQHYKTCSPNDLELKNRHLIFGIEFDDKKEHCSVSFVANQYPDVYGGTYADDVEEDKIVIINEQIIYFHFLFYEIEKPTSVSKVISIV